MRKWIPGVLVAAAYAFSAAVYSRLPARVPSHWGMHGVNGYTPRAAAAVMLPTLALVVWALMRWLPSIDPRRANYARFQSSYDAVVVAIVALVTALHVVMLGIALGWPLRMEVVAPAAVGAMFLVVGNVLPRARPNWFFGIRTPWTLSSDHVWERTHRVGGWVMTACGVVVIAAAFVGNRAAVIAITAMVPVMLVGVVGYSYVLWRREQRGQG